MAPPNPINWTIQAMLPPHFQTHFSWETNLTYFSRLREATPELSSDWVRTVWGSKGCAEMGIYWGCNLNSVKNTVIPSLSKKMWEPLQP